MSPFGIVALAALLFVLVSGLANPRTRPFMIGLGVLVVVGVVFLTLVKYGLVRREWARQEAVQVERPTKPIASPPAPSPPKSSAPETKRPKVRMIAAMGEAIVQAWAAPPSAPAAEAPENSAKTGQPDMPARPQPPAWVNSAPKLEDNRYLTSVRVGPFTTPLECERELPKALQATVSEYAELSLAPEAAAVRLPDDVLQQLVQERWTEVRPVEIGGGSQDMVSLHALVVFDLSAQERIKAAAQRLVIDRRVRGAAVVFSGVLGLLALAWGGLKLATKSSR